ncbi:hypothetical protein AB9K41_04770, partial [Cribrihabitans sp. XS_ASV171]
KVATGGDFSFTVPVDAAERAYRIEILAPTGAVEGSLDFIALRDSIPPEVALDLPPPRATAEERLQLSGSAPEAERLTLNGTPVPLDNGRFDLTVTLAPGQNGFELIATDAVGNVSAATLSTLYDIDPPEILRVDLGRPKGENGPIQLEVEARDASGLRQAQPFLITVDGAEIEGFLRCDAGSGLCRAQLPAEPGELELIEVMIEDYAGNAAFE